jgi:hypothetical protein
VKSFVRNPKDFWAGVIYMTIGLSAIVIARNYGIGATLKMGPGYFPTVLGGLLALIGAASLVRSFLRPGEPTGTWALKGLALVTVATVLCGLLVRTAGLAVALPVLVIVSAYGSVKFRWGPALLSAVALTICSILMFVTGLGVPLPIFGSWFGN